MSSNSEGVAQKAVEAIGGILQKLVELRMLILAMTLVVYMDIWLVYANVDVMPKTLSDVFGAMHSLTLKTLFFFVASYSLIMTATIPGARSLYSAIILSYGPNSLVMERDSSEEKQLSCWCTALVFFSLWDFFIGWFGNPGTYQGLIRMIFSQLELDGFAMAIFRLTVSGILIFCTARAAQADHF